MSHANEKSEIPTITFAQWCERQWIESGYAEGQAAWWHKQFTRAGWVCDYSAGSFKDCQSPLTVCDVARAVLALPPQSWSKYLPGCSWMWDSAAVWQLQVPVSQGLCADRVNIHAEARAVLAHYASDEVRLPRPTVAALLDGEASEAQRREVAAALGRGPLPPAPFDQSLAGIRWRVEAGGGCVKAGVNGGMWAMDPDDADRLAAALRSHAAWARGAGR